MLLRINDLTIEVGTSFWILLIGLPLYVLAFRVVWSSASIILKERELRLHQTIDDRAQGT